MANRFTRRDFLRAGTVAGLGMVGGRLKGAAFGHGLPAKRCPQAAIEDANRQHDHAGAHNAVNPAPWNCSWASCLFLQGHHAVQQS